ncbi:MAG: hypothetical protein QXY87_11760 [Saccharolobus sp.]|uniref:hypothetical protein n=1 Tax=Saccharolobus TaxID=2100760 RepID=UPI001F10FF1E|nr:hypothetical protein [Saccharolobus shibatae]MCH4816369.1 hypothetical protein [Saccharolobus shibatae]
MSSYQMMNRLVGSKEALENFQLDFETALQETIEKGKKMMLEEFNHFLSNKGNKEL